MTNPKQIQAVDFFCGAGGMSFGMEKAGIEILCGIDIDPECKETYEANHSGAKFIQKDIKKYTCEELEKEIEIKPNTDNLLFIGCSPCQYWSKINTDRNKSEKSKNLIKDFERFIDYFTPGYIVVENVPGIELKAEESGLTDFKEFLSKKGYFYSSAKIYAYHYGVPQKRRRYILVASRIQGLIDIPPKETTEKSVTVRKSISDQHLFPRIPDGHRDKKEGRLHTTMALSETNKQRIRNQKWRENPDLVIPAYKGKSKIFADVYGRMKWDEPAPTITTKFPSLSNGRFGHPSQDRAISLREGATLQTFPYDYKFIAGSIGTIARLIGNAVPPELARRLGNQIVAHWNTWQNSEPKQEQSNS